MGSIAKTSNFFKDRAVFGFDIGHGTLKVMQTDVAGSSTQVIGYGTASFDAQAIQDGIVINHEVIAKASLELFKHSLVGDITTNRVIIAIPAYRTFSRSINLPLLTGKELREAVELEASQYIPLPLEELYLSYSVTNQTPEQIDLFAVAVPRKIVDSQLQLMRVLSLETVGVQTTTEAAGRLFMQDTQSDVPSVIIDFGSLSADITIFKGQTLVTGTVSGGGEDFTSRIRDGLHVSQAEAQIIKTRYGLSVSKRQREVMTALEPILAQLAKEIRRMIRYYEDRYGTKRPIDQIITVGGGANMPGLTEYLTDNLRIATRSCDPWQYAAFRGLKSPISADKSMYATAMGLSLLRSEELLP